MADLSDLPVRQLPLQRRRVWRACECCRRKKIKCDGREPVCSQCTQTSSTCNWVQTKDRAALSRHYVQELEARLIQMEGLLTQVGSTPPTRTTDIGASSHHSQSSSSKHHHSTHGSSDETPAYVVDPDVPQEEAEPDHFGQLAVDHNGHLRWIGGSSAMTLVDAFRNISNRGARPSGSGSSRTGPVGHNLYFPPPVSSNVRALPGPEQAEFPPRDLADKLVAAYFTHFHHTLPVLDSTAFLSQYRRLMDERRIASHSEIAFAIVVFAVFACAARFVNDPRLASKDPEHEDAGMAAVYYERAMILFYIGHNATQLAHVQALVLLSSFLASVNSLPQSWLLCGQAVRIAQDLGLHRSPQHLLLTPIDKETRRKVWWCVYGLDRMLAVALGRPLGIDDSDCDVELPLDIDDVALPKYFASLPGKGASSSSTTEPFVAPATSLMKGFNALTCLFKIAGQVLRSVYALDKCKDNLDEEKMAELQASVDRLDKVLTEWCEKLPAPFKSNPQTSQQVSLGAILCSCYYAVTVTLHRNFIPTSVGSRQVPRSSSVAKAVTASRSCIFLAQSIKEVIPSSHWLAFFSQYLFSSAIIILLCIMHATDQNAVTTAMSEVNTAIECLHSLEPLWPGAKRCREILKELADVTHAKLQETLSFPPSAYGMPEGYATDGNTIRSPGRHLGGGAPLIVAPSPALSTSTLGSERPRRKRTIDEVGGSDAARPPHLAPKSAPGYSNTMPPPPSPSVMYGRSRASTLLSSPALSASTSGFRPQQLSRDDSSLSLHTTSSADPSSSYSLTSCAPSPAGMNPAWSTPRSSIAALSGNDHHHHSSSLPIELSTGLSPAASGGAGVNPFSISFVHTPGTSHLPLVDSAYLPPGFTYSLSSSTDPSDPTAHHPIAAPSPGQFDMSDLHFSGMDFLQTFGGTFAAEGGPNSEANEALWAQLGASPFKLAPELPFSAIEGSSGGGVAN